MTKGDLLFTSEEVGVLRSNAFARLNRPDSRAPSGASSQ
jgi:hypothetical protein